MIDLWTSRRDKFIKCEYWIQEEDNDKVDLEEVVHSKTSSGFFYAKEITPWNEEPQLIDATFKFRSVSVTIETFDQIDDLHEGDIVKVDEKIYRVESTQTAPVKKQRYFLKNHFSYKTVINLRG